METLIDAIMSAISEIYLEVVTKGANLKRHKVREPIYRELVAIWYATTAMIEHLGYTEADVKRTIESGVKTNAKRSVLPK